jgi:hypothetical protein
LKEAVGSLEPVEIVQREWLWLHGRLGDHGPDLFDEFTKVWKDGDLAIDLISESLKHLLNDATLTVGQLRDLAREPNEVRNERVRRGIRLASCSWLTTRQTCEATNSLPILAP